ELQPHLPGRFEDGPRGVPLCVSPADAGSWTGGGRQWRSTVHRTALERRRPGFDV
ncbi:MAG: hypothetical protein AVDCRST_MAG80-1307, partial [uncultured Rubrobacteraceae bacterium]